MITSHDTAWKLPFDELIEWLHEESASEGLVRAFWPWMGYAHVPEWRQGMDWPVLKDWREAGTMLRESVNEWTTKWMAQGRTQGRTEVMHRLAARKFGVETAERLAGRLEEITDPERAVEVGEWLLECDSGDELLDAGGAPLRVLGHGKRRLAGW